MSDAERLCSSIEDPLHAISAKDVRLDVARARRLLIRVDRLFPDVGRCRRTDDALENGRSDRALVLLCLLEHRPELLRTLLMRVAEPERLREWIEAHQLLLELADDVRGTVSRLQALARNLGEWLPLPLSHAVADDAGSEWYLDPELLELLRPKNPLGGRTAAPSDDGEGPHRGG